MENKEIVAPSFDDLVFENRNKEYGAYFIRKKYNKTMMWAILVGTLIIATAVVAPYVMAKVNTFKKKKEVTVSVTMDKLADPNDAPPPPPPPPPPPAEAQAQVRFVAPIVVDSVKVEDQNSFATADEAQEVVQNEDVNIVKVQETVEVEKPKEEEVFFIVEEMPGFQGGGIEGFREYVQGHLSYPEVAQENGIQGKVYISFVVEANGKISNVKVVRGVDPSLDKAAAAAVESGPTWTPGKQRGKAVRVTFTIPITFKLQ